MTYRVRSAVGGVQLVGALVLLAVACSDPGQITEPSPPPTVSLPPALPPAPPAPPPAFPALSRSGRIYRADDHLYDLYVQTHRSSLASRYVFYDSGQFALQFASVAYPFFEYVGRYTVVDSTITFAFAADARWQAVGTLKADSLFVTYDLIASLSDFVDGVYVERP